MVEKQTEEILYERNSSFSNLNKVKIQIIKVKGIRPYPQWLKDAGNKVGKDPNDLFLIRLVDLITEQKVEIPYSYDNQIELLKIVFDNIIVDRRFRDELGLFKNAITELEEKRKNG
jgi:hypothetical protein